MLSILFKWFMLNAALSGNPVHSPQHIPAGKHPVYMSVTEIEHNATDKTLEISCKVYINDFEITLRQNYKTFVDLLNPAVKPAMNKLVNDYIQKHLSVSVDGKRATLQFLGFEQQEDGIISYFQANNIPSVKKFDITDNILFDYKPEQISILHVIVNGNRKSTKLINPEDRVSVEF